MPALIAALLPLLPQLVGVFAPTILDLAQKHRAATGTDPTPEQIVAAFQTHFETLVADLDAWDRAHPATP